MPPWSLSGLGRLWIEQGRARTTLCHPRRRRTDLRVYWVDPGDMRTQMHQEAFPGEDISDRPLPEASVPGFLELLTGDLPSGRYAARALTPAIAGGGH